MWHGCTSWTPKDHPILQTLSLIKVLLLHQFDPITMMPLNSYTQKGLARQMHATVENQMKPKPRQQKIY